MAVKVGCWVVLCLWEGGGVKILCVVFLEGGGGGPVLLGGGGGGAADLREAFWGKICDVGFEFRGGGGGGALAVALMGKVGTVPFLGGRPGWGGRGLANGCGVCCCSCCWCTDAGRGGTKCFCGDVVAAELGAANGSGDAECWDEAADSGFFAKEETEDEEIPPAAGGGGGGAFFLLVDEETELFLDATSLSTVLYMYLRGIGGSSPTNGPPCLEI